MRHYNAQWWRSAGRFSALVTLVVGGAGAAHAQLPVFDTTDWVTDRGAIGTVPVTGGVNSDAFRPGYNGFMITDPAGGPPNINSILNNNPGLGVPRWVFPRTSDLRTTPTTLSDTVVVDNASRSYLSPAGGYAVPPAPTGDDQDWPNGDYVSDSGGNRVRAIPLPPGVFADGSYDPQKLAHMRYVPAGVLSWTLPDAVPFDNLDYRSPLGGYSINSDPSLPWDYDYAFTPAVFNQFNIVRNDGTTSPATSAEIAGLPYGSQDVVASINNTLNATSQLRAFYSMGWYNTAAGNYGVDVYLPGDGTLIGGIAHPSVSRAFVRVSWGTSAADGVNNTINPDGSFNTGHIQQLVNSRIFVVNMEGAGWYSLAGPGQSQTGIPYDGTPADQIVVEIYTLTPDDTNPGDPNSPYDQTPLVTCDAVRFRPIAVPTSPGLGLGAISAYGRVLAPPAATSKFNNANSPDIALTEKQPLVYIGREEIVQDFSVLVPLNPLLPVDPNPADPGYNPLVPDPTATKTVPVFYCIDNQNGDAQLGGAQITSIDKVRWRYQGLPDSDDLLIDGSNTTIAAPLLANVRCRDGIVRPMVFFTQVNADGSLGRVYAFDPVGIRAQLTTNLYWVYPSFRPIQTTDNNTNAQLTGVYYEYHDPNYKNTDGSVPVGPFGLKYVPGTYPITSFGNPAIADQALGADHYYDGEVSVNPAAPGTWQISPNGTLIPEFGSVTASPLLIDDPSNPAGPQILVVPNRNGRIYAFDAGGRGDFAPITAANPLPGTTQRLWTYPHFGADAYHALGLNGKNTILDDNSKLGFAQTPAYDVNYTNVPTATPFFVGAMDGYVYAINPIKDAIGIPAVLGSQHANWNDGARLNWQYPAPGAFPLTFSSTFADISNISIFTATSNKKYLYFTATGRVYCLPEFTNTTVNSPQWIFPFTNNPPYASDPNDTIIYNFAAMAPIAIQHANLPGSTQDEVYILDSTGTAQMLDPFGAAGATTVQAVGQSITGAFTTSAPILSQLQSQYYYSPTGAIGTSQPAVVFGDSQGSLWGLESTPETINGVPTLAVIWSQFDSTQSRDANVVLANGMLLSGSEDGQLRAYGVGTGLNQDQTTLGTGEPAQATPGVGTLSVDVRTVDLYAKQDWQSMELGPSGIPPNPPNKKETPMRDENGNSLTNTAPTLTSNVSGNIVAVDWGDYLYVVAAGVYHAQPQDMTQLVYGTTTPTVSVVFTLTQPGQAPVTYPVSGVPLIAPGFIPGQGLTPASWPDDLGITAGEHNNLKIYGMDAADGTFKTLTGPTGSVFPWVAKIRIPVDPSGRTAFAPATIGYKLTVQATIQQTVVNNNSAPTIATNYSNVLGLGQPNWTGFDLTPSVPGGPITVPNSSRLPAGRSIGVTNPIALTVRGYTGNGSIDMTGTASHNVIGWHGSVLEPIANIGELLGNGNIQSIPGVVAAGSQSPIKDLFAPIGLISDGSAKDYKAINGARQPIDALYIADRSALGRMTGNKSFQLQVTAQSPQWYGGASSVMNPLPWEVMPISTPVSTTASPDYPGLGERALSIKTGNGQDAIHSLVTLNSPIYHDRDPIDNPDPDPDPVKSRLISPTLFKLNVQVPLYQPANVNRGVSSAKLWDGTTFNFGQPFVGLSGIAHGANVTTDPVIGPVQSTTGDPVAAGDSLAFPAAGYTGLITVQAIPPPAGASNNSTGLSSRQTLLLGRNTGGVSGPQTTANRQFYFGASVPVNTRLRTLETTVDLGKLPHGSGYTDIAGAFYRTPFAPTNSADFPLTPNGQSTYAPWDDPNSTTLAQMFRPFTLISESNINLINPRAAKLVGVNGAPILANSRSITASPILGDAIAFRLNSDQVNNLSISPLIAAGFAGPGVGNIGLVTSLDHISASSNPSVLNPNFLEHPIWPITNPYVYAQDVAAVNAANRSLIVTNSLNLGVRGWTGNVQPQPTIGKPRVGDASGHIATIPDKPHDAPDIKTLVLDPTGTVNVGGVLFRQISYFTAPEIGFAIPLGTPAGTYAGTVNFYEDSTPPQWQEWLAASAANFISGTPNDGILNTTAQNAANEVHTDPSFSLKVAVREARLTGGFTTGDLAQVDSTAFLNGLPYPGVDTMPAVYMAPGNIAAGIDPRQLWLYWSTNRTGGGASPPASGPWALAAAALPAPYALIPGNYPAVTGDFNFSVPGAFNASQWWTQPTLYNGFNAGGTGSAAQPSYLFPMSPAEQTAATSGAFVPPFLAASGRLNQTTRMSNPAVASALNLVTNGYGAQVDTTDKEAYLFWQGQIDKTQGGSFGGNAIIRDIRTFFQPLGQVGTALGAPVGPTFSMRDDPALVKLSPKPLLVKLPAGGGAPAQKFLFLFWHAGSGSSTQIYYNVASSNAVNAAFNPAGGEIWNTDTVLPLPGSLVSESDPYPTYRHVFINGVGEVDAVDVAFTGVLKNRQKVEILLARYQINRVTANGVVGALTLLPLPRVTQETLTRVGTTNTFASRDAFWGLGTGPNGTIQTTDTNGLIAIDFINGNTGQFSHLNWKYKVDPATQAFVPGSVLPLAQQPQVGTFDPASGLVSYNAFSVDDGGNAVSGLIGGQINVDARSGTITFPQVAPLINDTVLVSYTPYVMRLSTSRDETNVIRDAVFAGSGWVNDRAFALRPSANSPGSNSVPVLILDRGPNPRWNLQAPKVVFPALAAAPELDRMWVLYRKNDPSGAVKSTVYYKAMRLMIKLPRPFLITQPDANGQQQLAAVPTVVGNNGPVEVDWVRGRLYFTEVDEGAQIRVSYQYFDTATGTSGNSGNLDYTVAWGDEMSSASSTGDETTPENPLPTDQAVSEGTVAAFKDPYLDKLWVFWTSTRSNTTNLYYETIAPQLYPTASNQQ